MLKLAKLGRIACGFLACAPLAFGAASNQIPHEPLLVYDVTGSTLLGPLHTSLSVYNDGTVSYVSLPPFVLGAVPEVRTVFVGQPAVQALSKDLSMAGAGTLQDNFGAAQDIPLTTVTFMRPATDTRAHTFSFLFAGPGHQAVSLIVNEFIQENITSPPSLGSSLKSTSSPAVSGGTPVFGGLPFKREPMLFWDITGSTLLGPIHISMAVYNDGLVSYGSSNQLGGPDTVVNKLVPISAVRDLGEALRDAGAATLPDNLLLVLDIPLSTVSFARPNTDTRMHTFSYYAGTSSYGDVSIAVNTFIADHVLN